MTERPESQTEETSAKTAGGDRIVAGPASRPERPLAEKVERNEVPTAPKDRPVAGPAGGGAGKAASTDTDEPGRRRGGVVPADVAETPAGEAARPALGPDSGPADEAVRTAKDGDAGRTGEPAITRLIDSADSERFQNRWRDIKAGFVDDPQQALRQAASLSDDVVAALTTALDRHRRDLSGRWNDGQADTERLRVALRDYGALLDRLLGT